MPKYLFQGAYIGDGLSGLVAEGGSSRVEAAKALFESLGGSLECFYFALGSDDLIVICDLPDNVSAAAFTLAVTSTGKARGHTTPLLSPEDIDRAASLSPHYRAPGGS